MSIDPITAHHVGTVVSSPQGDPIMLKKIEELTVAVDAMRSILELGGGCLTSQSAAPYRVALASAHSLLIDLFLSFLSHPANTPEAWL